MGLDGLFLDNADVYYKRDRRHIQGEHDYDRTERRNIRFYNKRQRHICFKSHEEGTARTLFDGVNQETVFTNKL